ncbi:MAG TPA: hypothetical protein VF939_06515 [Puia sp.]
MRKNFEQFVTAVVFLLFLPLFPLLAEFIKTHDLKKDALTLSFTFYCFCLAVSTNSLLTFTLCLVLGMIESLRYNGRSAQSALPVYSTVEFYIFLMVFIIHGGERFIRHYRNAEKFLTFI